jgi:serine phosphatase RsbU (regulator of sigma subunit)
VHLFTDGVYDVERDGDLLSPDWLRGEIQSRAKMQVAEVFDELLCDLRALNGPKEFADDICMVAMELALPGSTP